MLERLFTSRVRVRLLTLFLTHPTEAFYIRQIARLTGETYNNVRQELQNLAQLGLILSERRANATYYRANVEHFLFPELSCPFPIFRSPSSISPPPAASTAPATTSSKNSSPMCRSFTEATTWTSATTASPSPGLVLSVAEVSASTWASSPAAPWPRASLRQACPEPCPE